MKYFAIFLISIILFGCSAGGGKTPTDTPTAGKIKIAVDESLEPLMDAEVKAFNGLYTNASITALYVTEAEAIRLLLLDSVRLSVLTRTLNKEENEELTKQKFVLKTSKVAREGIALIVHPDNPDTLWDMAKVQSVLKGERSDIKVVFDNQNSGISRFIMDSVLHSTTLPPNSYAVENNQAVIDYITKEKKAVGLIGGAWISDRDDSVANQFLGSINVIAIKDDGQTDYQKPYQAYIAQKTYPLIRDIVINLREPRAGLGTGFTSFVAGEKGQRIVLKAGLVPVTMPIRVVQISREPL